VADFGLFVSFFCVRYCKLLLQEFSVKVDQGFLGAMLSMFTSGKVDEDQQVIAFRQDCELVGQSLMTDTIQTSSAGVRHFYDDLHCSPIKVKKDFCFFPRMIRSLPVTSHLRKIKLNRGYIAKI
jgi:hypothetical protein